MSLASTLLLLLLTAGGALAWLGSRAAPIRGLGRGIATLLDPRARRIRADLLSVGGGATAVAGGALALQTAGPGALFWMWIGAALSMAWIYTEVRVGIGGEEIVTRVRASLGRGPAAAFALFLAALGLAVGGWFAVQQAGITWAEALHVPQNGAIIVASVALAAALLHPRTARRLRAALGYLVVPAVALIGLTLLAALLQTPAATGDALAEIVWSVTDPAAAGAGIAGGVWLVAAAHAALWCALNAGFGLGAAAHAASTSNDDKGQTDERDGHGIAAATMLVPVVSACLISTMVGLLLLTTDTATTRELVQRERASDGEPGPPLMLPLERKHQRGFRPSPSSGQLVVLPRDTPLQLDKNYPMTFRANARGHKFGKLNKPNNTLVLPAWDITKEMDTLVFRDKDPERAQNPGYDRRIPVLRESVTNDRGKQLVLLKPLDPDVDLSKLADKRDGPYAVIDDFRFVGTVGQVVGSQEKLGDYLAMYEVRQPDDPPNPNLRQVLEAGLRGPYLGQTTARAPWALVAREGWEAPVGTVLRLELNPPKRGLEIGERMHNGDIRTPAWSFLSATTEAILRHKQDPSLDRRVPVEHELGSDGTLRFSSARPEVVDFARAGAMKAFSGPYLAPPPYVFDVEVHRGVRLPQEYGERHTLVPVHEQVEARGGDGEVYKPHPYEVLRSEMEGPTLPRPAVLSVADGLETTLGRPAVYILGALLGVLALAAAGFWISHLGASLGVALGGAAATLVRVAFPLAVLAAAWVPLHVVLELSAWAAVGTSGIAALALSLSPTIWRRTS